MTLFWFWHCMRFSWETKALKTSVVYTGLVYDLSIGALARFEWTYSLWIQTSHFDAQQNNQQPTSKTAVAQHFGRRCCQSHLSVIWHNHSELRSPLSHGGSCYVNYMGLCCPTILLGFDAALDKLQSVLPVYCRQLKMCNWVFPSVIVYLKSCTLQCCSDVFFLSVCLLETMFRLTETKTLIFTK